MNLMNQRTSGLESVTNGSALVLNVCIGVYSFQNGNCVDEYNNFNFMERGTLMNLMNQQKSALGSVTNGSALVLNLCIGVYSFQNGHWVDEYKNFNFTERGIFYHSTINVRSITISATVGSAHTSETFCMLTSLVSWHKSYTAV